MDIAATRKTENPFKAFYLSELFWKTDKFIEHESRFCLVMFAKCLKCVFLEYFKIVG